MECWIDLDYTGCTDCTSELLEHCLWRCLLVVAGIIRSFFLYSWLLPIIYRYSWLCNLSHTVFHRQYARCAVPPLTLGGQSRISTDLNILPGGTRQLCRLTTLCSTNALLPRVFFSGVTQDLSCFCLILYQQRRPKRLSIDAEESLLVHG